MRIAVDLSGGDKAPGEILKGVLEFAVNHSEHSIILCAVNSDIHLLSGISFPPNITVKYFSDKIEMSDSPVQAKKEKPENTITGMLDLAKGKDADCAFSCGNTGAVILNSMDIFGQKDPKVPPSLVSLIPRYKDNPSAIFDSGALGNHPFNADTYFSILPEVIDIYRNLYGKNEPSIAILNIGSEAWKGTVEHKKIYQSLSASDYNFLGNIEGDGLINAGADIIISGGFTGNVALKLLESVSGLLSNFKKFIGCKFEDNYLNFLTEDLRYEKIGGAMLTGVNGKVMIGHGKSSSEAVYSALELCAKWVNV
jgi:phosphate acyltransferase